MRLTETNKDVVESGESRYEELKAKRKEEAALVKQFQNSETNLKRRGEIALFFLKKYRLFLIKTLNSLPSNTREIGDFEEHQGFFFEWMMAFLKRIDLKRGVSVPAILKSNKQQLMCEFQMRVQGRIDGEVRRSMMRTDGLFQKIKEEVRFDGHDRGQIRALAVNQAVRRGVRNILKDPKEWKQVVESILRELEHAKRSPLRLQAAFKEMALNTLSQPSSLDVPSEGDSPDSLNQGTLLLDLVPSQDEDPEKEVERREILGKIKAALEELKRKDASLYGMIYSYFFEEKSLEHIGDELGRSKEGVRKLIAKGLTVMEDFLGEEFRKIIKNP